MKNNLVYTVPNLTIATAHSLLQFEKKILSAQCQIESWFRQHWQQTQPPIYCSVDLRNAGFKLAPVDTNLFPAGFNNLNPDFMPLCVQAIQHRLERISPGCRRILLIPESHSRNLFYFESVAVIQKILVQAGYEVRIGSLIPDLKHNREIALRSGQKLTLEPLLRHKNRLSVENYSPCVVVLNHDLSEGIPDILKNVEQMILPPLGLGWSSRLKTKHFNFYKIIAKEFAALIDIDPWLINPLYRRCEEVNFMDHTGEQCLAKHVEELLDAIQIKYDQYEIDQKPFVVIKADAGTYGMGVMMVHNSGQVLDLNRKQRKKMAKTKGGRDINKVILQEGVYTFETMGENNDVAEPVVYMIGQDVVGGFYRVHTQRGPDENLNAPGAHFEPWAFAEPCIIPDNRFYIYGVVARLALLAAAQEKKTANVTGPE